MKDLAAMTEHEALEAKRNAFKEEKAAARKGMKAARALMEINTAAGRHQEANAAFGAMAKDRKRLGQIEEDHSDGTEKLFQFWPEHAVEEEHGGVIVAKSGHR